MKKRKQLISSECLETWSVRSPDSGLLFQVHLVEHKQLKSGIRMYSLDIGLCPVITCDSQFFLSELMDFGGSDIFMILFKIAMLRGFPISNLNSESEE